MSNLLNNKQIAQFSHEMSMMIASGMTIEESLDQISKNSEIEDISAWISVMEKNVEEGNSIADAIAYTGLFPKYYEDTIRLSGLSGRYEESFSELAVYYEKKEEVQESVRSLIVRPLAFFAILGALLSVMIFKIIPIFENVYNRLAGYSTLYTKAAYIICYVMLTLIAVCLLGSLVLYAFKETKWSKKIISSIVEKSFLTKDVSLTLARSHFISMINIMVKSGIEQTYSVKKASDQVTHNTLSERAEKALSRLDHGENMGLVFNEEKVLPDRYSYMLYISSNNGKVEDTLSIIARSLEEDVVNSMNKLISRIEPIITLAFTLSLGLSLMAIMLPLIAIITNIG